MPEPKRRNPEELSAGFVSVTKAEQWWVEKSRRSLPHFITYLYGGSKRPADHHLEWMLHFLNPANKRVLIIAPRESAKTTLLVSSLAWIIGHRPMSTNIFVSVSAQQAIDRLDMLKQLIELPQYQNVFPWIHLDKIRPFNKSEFSVWSERWSSETKEPMDYRTFRSAVARYGDPKNPTVFAAGITSSKIIGRRFSGTAFVDDPHDSSNSATEEGRAKVEKFFNENILGGVSDRGQVVVVTTRWAETDLAGRLIEKRNADGSPVWHYINTPAIQINDHGQPVSYWPDQWPISRLEAKRSEVGEVMFQTMYMNNPLAMAGGAFSVDQLRVDLPEELPQFASVVVSIDIASSQSANADYTVAAAIAKDKDRLYNLFVLDLIRGRWDFNGALNEISMFCERVFETYGRLDGVYFEKQGLQNAWSEELKRRSPHLPVEQVSVRGDKAHRLDGVSVKASGKKLFINQQMTALPALMSELLGFPRSQHDDICDAISLPLQHPNWVSLPTSGIVMIEPPKPNVIQL